MHTIVLYLCYIVLILLFSTAYNTSLIYCFVIWCLHTDKRRPCSSTLSGHPSSSLSFLFCMASTLFNDKLKVGMGHFLHSKWKYEGKWRFRTRYVCILLRAVEVSKSHPLTTWDIDETWVIGTFPVGGLCKCDIWSLSRGTFRPVLKCQGIRQILPCNQAFFASIQIIQLGWLEMCAKSKRYHDTIG